MALLGGGNQNCRIEENIHRLRFQNGLNPLLARGYHARRLQVVDITRVVCHSRKGPEERFVGGGVKIYCSIAILKQSPVWAFGGRSRFRTEGDRVLVQTASPAQP